MAEHLFRLDATKVGELSDMETAFDTLLGEPLNKINQPVLLVIDALDEADPPEQQVEGFAGNVKPCGNKTLQLLIRRLAHLPEGVRFVITTRSDAVCGQVKGVLARAFEDSIAFVRPGQLRAETKGRPNMKGMMLYHTLVQEYASSALALEGKLCPTMQDVYGAYERGFSASGTSILSDVRVVLEILLAAQEPLAQSMMQQMGLSSALKQLPGWGVLFFAQEHRVYMVHKSLSDWLHARQLKGQPGSLLQLDISMGHLSLAKQLSKSRASPSQYALKYLGLHLCAAVEHHACKQILDAALDDWDFLVRVMKAKCGVYWTRALGGIPKDQHTIMSYETMRWLKLAVNILEGDPSMNSFNDTACIYCPLGSLIHEKAATSDQYSGYKCAKVLGRESRRWQATVSLFQVISTTQRGMF